MGNKYTVYISQEKLPPLKEIAEILAKSKGMIFYDAMQKISKMYGFIEENTDENTANIIIKNAKEKNIQADRILSEKTPKLKDITEIKDMILDENKISFTVNGNLIEKNISDMQILSYAPINIKRIKTVTEKKNSSLIKKTFQTGVMLTTGIPLGMGKSKEVKKEIHETDTELYLDIIFKDKTHLRINSNNFNYSCLGKDKTYSSFMNFKILAAKIANLTTKSLKNSALYSLLENQQPIFKYNSIADFEKETLRLLLISGNF